MTDRGPVTKPVLGLAFKPTTVPCPSIKFLVRSVAVKDCRWYLLHWVKEIFLPFNPLFWEENIIEGKQCSHKS